MNIMDKDSFIKIYNNFINGVLSTDELVELFTSYCLEHNKKQEDITKFVTIIVAHPMITRNYIEYPINYYENKFNVTKIYNQNQKLIKII